MVIKSGRNYIRMSKYGAFQANNGKKIATFIAFLGVLLSSHETTQAKNMVFTDNFLQEDVKNEGLLGESTNIIKELSVSPISLEKGTPRRNLEDLSGFEGRTNSGTSWFTILKYYFIIQAIVGIVAFEWAYF